MKAGNGGWRRSIYLQYRRTEIPTMMDTFDYPEMGPNCFARSVSTVIRSTLGRRGSGSSPASRWRCTRSSAWCSGVTALGVDPPARIVPFRGEYFVLSESAQQLVRVGVLLEDASHVEQRHPVGQLQTLGDVVGHQDRRYALGNDTLYFIVAFLPESRVSNSQDFINEQYIKTNLA